VEVNFERIVILKTISLFEPTEEQMFTQVLSRKLKFLEPKEQTTSSQ